MIGRSLRRAGASLLALLAATAVTFVLVDRASDPRASLRARQPAVPQATLDEVAARLYLDRSVPERYWLWLTGLGRHRGDIGVLRGAWGPSVRELDIGEELRDRSAASFRLLASATVVVFAVAVATGVVAATRRGSRLDGTLTVVGYALFAVPTFWMSTLVKEAGVWVNDRLGRRLVFTVGESSPDVAGLGGWARAGDLAGHLVLPTIVIVLAGYAVISRHQRASTLEVLDSDYVRLARAKGLRRGQVLRRHALRTSLIPTSALAALAVSGTVTASVIVERVFRWRGLGSFMLESVQAGDTYAVMAFVVVSGALVTAANLAADCAVAALDPRTRRG